jgi:hypothetical protein
MKSYVSSIYYEVGDSGTVSVLHSDKLSTEADVLSSEEAVNSIKKSITEKNLTIPSEVDQCVIISALNLLNAGVFGVSDEWSLNYSKKAASSMLLDVKWVSELKNKDGEALDENVDIVLISGGYDGCEGVKIRRLIRAVSQIEWIKTRKPLIVFRGSSKEIDNAKLYFSPFTRFAVMKNVLLSRPGYCDNNIDNIVESIYFSRSNLSDEIKKYPAYVYSSILEKIADQFCTVNLSMQSLFYIAENFTVFTDCEKKDGFNHYRRFSLPKSSRNIESSDFAEIYDALQDSVGEKCVDFKIERSSPFSINSSTVEKIYRPSGIIAVVMDEKIKFDKFLDLVSDPDRLRGLIDIIFDNSGLIPALIAMLIKKDFDERMDVDDIVQDIPVKRGWLLIPDGEFEKDKEALSIQVSGATKIESLSLVWGKRYSYNIEPSSSIEISFKGKVFFNGMKGKELHLKSFNGKKVLVIDLRKEKS